MAGGGDGDLDGSTGLRALLHCQLISRLITVWTDFLTFLRDVCGLAGESARFLGGMAKAKVNVAVKVNYTALYTTYSSMITRDVFA